MSNLMVVERWWKPEWLQLLDMQQEEQTTTVSVIVVISREVWIKEHCDDVLRRGRSWVIEVEEFSLAHIPLAWMIFYQN